MHPTKDIESDDALLWSIPTATRRLGGVHRTTIWRRVKSGEFTAVHLGKRTMIVAQSVHNWIAKQAKHG
jgi:hypothetical protein